MELTEQTKKELEERFAALEVRRRQRIEEEHRDAEEAAALKVLLRENKPDPNVKQTLPLFQSAGPGDGDAMSFRDRVRQAIVGGSGRKMTIGDVVKALEEQGFKHEGKTPVKIKVGNELYKLSKQSHESIQGNGKGLYWAKTSAGFVQRNSQTGKYVPH